MELKWHIMQVATLVGFVHIIDHFIKSSGVHTLLVVIRLLTELVAEQLLLLRER